MSALFVPAPAGVVLSVLSLLAFWHSMWLSLSTDPHRDEVGPILSTVGLCDVVLFPLLAALLWPAALALTAWVHAARILRTGPTPEPRSADATRAFEHDRGERPR